MNAFNSLECDDVLVSDFAMGMPMANAGGIAATTGSRHSMRRCNGEALDVQARMCPGNVVCANARQH